MTEKKLQVGDVIRGGDRWNLTEVDSSNRIYVSDNPGHGFTKRKLNLANALFVVESAKRGGGGYGHGPHDYYPDGWEIQARLLFDDGSYNPNGPVVHFYETSQGGAFTCMAQPAKVGEMKRVVTFTPVEPSDPMVKPFVEAYGHWPSDAELAEFKRVARALAPHLAEEH